MNTIANTVTRAAKTLDATLANAWDQGIHSIPTLRALVFIGEQGSPSLSAIANHVGISTAAITGMADTFEKKGLATRVRPAGDRRAIQMALTPAGESAVRNILAA